MGPSSPLLPVSRVPTRRYGTGSCNYPPNPPVGWSCLPPRSRPLVGRDAPCPTHPPGWCPSGHGWPLPGETPSVSGRSGSAPRSQPPPPALDRGSGSTNPGQNQGLLRSLAHSYHRRGYLPMPLDQSTLQPWPQRPSLRPPFPSRQLSGPRLSACAARTDGWAGKGANRPRTALLTGWAAVALRTPRRLPPPTSRFSREIKTHNLEHPLL